MCERCAESDEVEPVCVDFQLQRISKERSEELVAIQLLIGEQKIFMCLETVRYANFYYILNECKFVWLLR